METQKESPRHRLRKVRERLGFTAKDMAKSLNYGHTSYWRFESEDERWGQSQSSQNAIMRLLRMMKLVYRVNPVYILKGEGDPILEFTDSQKEAISATYRARIQEQDETIKKLRDKNRALQERLAAQEKLMATLQKVIDSQLKQTSSQD